MTGKKPNTDHWISLISKRELPALTSTAQLLDKFANDDVSSLPRLSKAILHDQALSTCLLKVANSVQRYGVNQVSTVSRATVILGVQTVKNICLTSKIIESLLKNKDLDISIYNKIKQLMANSFYAGQLAKMMLPNYSDDTKEEVYLAAMLRRIGETAFWCLGKEFKNELEELVELPREDYEQACNKLIGISFDELSTGLAKTWNLGDLLVKSLDHPEQRTEEMQVIYLADKLVQYIERPPPAKDYEELMTQIATIMDINERQLAHKIHQVKENSVELLASYGAQMLADLVKDLPKSSELLSSDQQIIEEVSNKEAALLQALQYLSEMTLSSKDINQFIDYTLIQIARILAFDNCAFYLLTSNKTSLSCRHTFDRAGKPVESSLTFVTGKKDSSLNRILRNNQAIKINSQQEHLAAEFPYPVDKLFEQKSLALGSVNIKQNNIGVIVAQRSNINEISNDELNKFQFFIQHLSMCLSMITPVKK
ncbi:HDOD domain-containing protein [Thalassotalea sp. M1531]|uniref:HDOD domain-containing protein n=1 Tax=Thalassotalea algicola TaxID=2716224 RepID=A0A7Y0LDY0_9GAMM|nr:HDOD domain-containing protein [Thalassotalea algicola]NMP32423.1 HDOD domain-containing protein [Thalassotalea algicola]